jgi:uncharacterized protein YegP (UPF0339 family)
MIYYISKYREGQSNGAYYWYLQAANGKKVAWSGEAYWNKGDCEHAIALVKSSHAAPVKDLSGQ